jgi:hypothetical protein
MMDLTKAAAYSDLTPYDLWQESEKFPSCAATDQDIKSGGTQIEYQDQDPEIHAVFLSECRKRGTEVRMAIG